MLENTRLKRSFKLATSLSALDALPLFSMPLCLAHHVIQAAAVQSSIVVDVEFTQTTVLLPEGQPHHRSLRSCFSSLVARIIANTVTVSGTEAFASGTSTIHNPLHFCTFLDMSFSCSPSCDCPLQTALPPFCSAF